MTQALYAHMNDKKIKILKKAGSGQLKQTQLKLSCNFPHAGIGGEEANHDGGFPEVPEDGPRAVHGAEE
jgi:hypothetical protein